MTADLVARARDLAHRAHAGQVDKAGRQYIEHVARVAAAVRLDGRCDERECYLGMIPVFRVCSDDSYVDFVPCQTCDEAEAVAWLHDVLEDAPEFSAEMYKLPSRIWLVCNRLDRTSKWDDFYYWRIRSNPLALRIKLADIADNADESRLALLDKPTADRLRQKYARARKALGV